MKRNDSSGLLSLWNNILVCAQSFYGREVVQNIALLASGSFIAQGLMAINAIVIARFLAPEAYGLYVGAYSAVGLSSFLVNWGLDTWILRQGALADDPPALAGSILTIKGVLGVFWGTALFFLLPALEPNIFLKPLILISTLDVWCDGFFSAELATLNTQKRVSVVSSLLLTSRGGRLLSAISVVGLGAQSPVSFAQARLVATIIALIMASWVLRPKFVAKLIRPVRAFRESGPFALSDLLATIYLQADVTLLALFLGDRRAVGLYAPASGLVNALFAIPAASYQITLPALMRLDGQEVRSFRHVVSKMFLGFLALGIFLWLGLWMSGSFLIEHLLGSAYRTTGELLSILSPILLLKSISFAGAALLVAVGWQHYRVIAQVVSAAANVLLNVLVIRHFGIWGVATVYVVSEFILAAGYVGLAMRWFRDHPNGSGVVKWT